MYNATFEEVSTKKAPFPLRHFSQQKIVSRVNIQSATALDTIFLMALLQLRGKGLLWHFYHNAIIYFVVAPNLATERG